MNTKKPVSPNVTQRMVAARAGVSQGAVSHILGGFGDRYNKKTREEVFRTARELGYHPNRAAQAMRRGRSNVIVHLNFSGYSELAGRKSSHLGRFIHEAGFDYQAIDSYWWPEDGEKLTGRILSQRPEGLVVSGALQSSVDFKSIRDADIAIVMIDARADGVARVYHDVRGAIKELTLQCLAQGRLPVLMLRRHPGDVIDLHWSIQARREGFFDALHERGFDPVPEVFMDGHRALKFGESPMIIWSMRNPDSDALFGDGEHAARCLLDSGTPPGALICLNDFYAIGARGVLMEAGVRIPEDVAVAGFDNLAYSMQRSVGLTTVEHPIEAMCKEAISMLKERMGGKQQSPDVIEKAFPCQIHWRRSLPRNSSAGIDERTSVFV